MIAAPYHDRAEDVREFALGLLAYEKEHASGPETAALIAVANDLLEIVGRAARPS